MKFTISHITKLIKGKHIGQNKKTCISHLVIDSRKLFDPETSLFFAINGERHDGHRFIPELYEKGVRNFAVDHFDENWRQYNDADFVVVNDAKKALQLLSGAHRKQFDIPVIGITGSNGKTVVKEWLFQLLHEDKNIVRSPKSFNSQVGVPLSVWNISPHHDVGIFEAGISQPGEMEKLREIILPRIGIFTNIGEAHNEGFRSIRQKVREKLKLFAKSDVLIYCSDYEEIEKEIVQLNAGVKLVSWSHEKDAFMKIYSIKKTDRETCIRGKHNGGFLEITIPFTDNASVENAIHCWVTMLYLGYDNTIIAKRAMALSAVAMRLEIKKGINNCIIINDSYNSDAGSIEVALDFLIHQKQHEKKTVILSDVLQSGEDDRQLYSRVSEMINKKGVDRLIGIGASVSKHAGLFKVEKDFYSSTDDFMNSSLNFSDEIILLKGARSFRFERISKLLEQQAHETVLEINLDAIVHNLNYFRAKLYKKTKIMVMVKAFAYGSGSFEIANVLQFNRVNYLGVAYADEGIELRNAGITVPVIVMNPEIQSFDSMIKYGLEPELYNLRLLNYFANSLSRSLHQPHFPYPVHIKLDTGMNRLGFTHNEIPELLDKLSNMKNILKVESVFSHLAAADEDEHDDFTKQQIEKFNNFSNIMMGRLGYSVIRHILNSAGILRFPEAQFDMVRIGIGLYGSGFADKNLRNVSTLKSTISQIRKVPADETIGYGRKGIAGKPITIAVVPIGYADGLNRKLGNGKGKLIVNGNKVSIVGNVCMDMCMINITGLDVKEGDEVIIFGEEYPVGEFAKNADTISYEALTGISSRVKRIYFHE